MWYWLRRYLSYVLPLTRRVPSAISGRLEITWHNGRKLLDTRNANYSYGSLQQVLRYGLLFVQPEQAGHVLLLGLGGGCVVQTLRQELGLQVPITAIELDPVVIRLADEEFGIRPDAGLHIVCADAFAWIRTAPPAAFGLLIIDLFIDLEMPAQLQTDYFWELVWRVLEPGGRVLFNALTLVELRINCRGIVEHLRALGFAVQELEVEQLNRLLILRKP